MLPSLRFPSDSCHASVLHPQVALDGVNHWPALTGASLDAPRRDLVYNIDFSPVDDSISGAIRVGDMKLLVHSAYSSIWPVPKDDHPDGGDRAAAEDTVPTDYLFDLSVDPTESHDLREEQPEVFETLMRRFSEEVATMVPTAYCGAADNAAADLVFEKTQFITPWITDENFKCPGLDRETILLRWRLAQCAFSLVPDEECGDFSSRVTLV